MDGDLLRGVIIDDFGDFFLVRRTLCNQGSVVVDVSFQEYGGGDVGVEMGHYVVVGKGGLVDSSDVGRIFYGGGEEGERHFLWLFVSWKRLEIRWCARFGGIMFVIYITL